MYLSLSLSLSVSFSLSLSLSFYIYIYIYIYILSTLLVPEGPYKKWCDACLADPDGHSSGIIPITLYKDTYMITII